MDDQIKNAEESFEIIRKMIENEKVRFNENGFVYLFWGWLAIFAASLQYALLFSGVRQNYYAWFVMLFGGVYMYFYFRNKKGSTPMPLTGKVLSTIWIIIGLNIWIFAFLFPVTAGNLLLFFILAMIGVGTIISGALIRFSWLTYGGIVCNILAFATIFAPPIYWGAISIVAIIFADLIPGYMLRAKYHNQNV
ncbi:MAG: hypothetical protein EHM93_07230 [Bacteroidales bacterium]|nr:MAG: hypothetical protein EHM93_07230 [Bacteroidales bacterium]